MANKNENYRLNYSQLDQALKILDEEKEAYLPSMRQEKKFRFLINGAIVYILLFCATIYFFYVGEFSEQSPEATFYGFISFCCCLSSNLLLIPLFIANIPFFFRYWRQFRLIRKLGLNQVFSAPWKKERRKIISQNISISFLLYIGIFLICCSVLFLFVSVSTGFIDGTNDFISIIVIVLGLITLFAGTIFIFLSSVIKSRQRIKVVRRLRNSLLKYKELLSENTTSEIEIPREDYDLLAKLERVQITRNQVKSIRDDIEESHFSDYSILMSREFREALLELSVTERLSVDNQIDKLLKIAPSSEEDSKTQKNSLQFRVPAGALLEIIYQIDTKSNQIILNSLKKIANEDL